MISLSNKFSFNRSKTTAFHRTHTFEKRKEEADRILKKYPDRVPIIAQRSETDTSIPDIDNKKYLVPRDLSVGQLMYIIRKRIKLAPEKAIFAFIGNTIPPTSQLISQLYQELKDKDGFLYIEIAGESTFG